MITAAYLKAVENAYQGEVYGENLYRMIAAAQSEAVRSWKWRVMARMEFETKHLMRRLVARHGGTTLEDEASKRQATIDFERYRDLAWPDLMRVFSAELVADIAEYAELEYDGPPRDRRILQRLTDHEVVTKRFCDLEIQGQADDSITPVVKFCKMPPVRP